MKRIIAISGKAGSGKDYYARAIQAYLKQQKGERVCIIAFADILKYTLSKYFGWDGKKDNNGREMLQRYGTELREKNSPDCWANITCNLIEYMKSEYDTFIIPDVRFERELLTLKLRFDKVYPIRICRFDTERMENGGLEVLGFHNELNEEQRAHSSEIDLDFYDNWFAIFYNYTNTGFTFYNVYQLCDMIEREENNSGLA